MPERELCIAELFIFPSGLTTLLPAYSRCWHDTKLLHHRHLIHYAPVFHKLAVSNADNIDHVNGYALAGWRNAHKLALMGAGPGLTDYHLVAFGDNIVDRGFEFWEGAAQPGGQLFDALTITRNAGWELFAFNEVGRQELVGPTHVSPIEDFLRYLTD